jgi:hypothetical protein
MLNKNKYCIIDFDGTFLKNDFFEEIFFKTLILNPMYLIIHFFIKRKGILELKNNLLKNYFIHYDINFLINKIVLQWINDNKSTYKKLILVSATPDFFVKRILKNISCFDEIYGSINTNLKGDEKLNFIINNLNNSFDYVGNSKDDIPIFKKASIALKITNKGLIYV